MFKSLKRVLATASTVALLVSNVGVAFAQTFRDVPTDSWYYDYVEQLVNDGVIEAGTTFNPAGRVNRAEMAKLVVTAVDGLADYEAPATPTFDDVPKSSPNFDYIEAAVQLGILAGYTDTKGNLTGKFGPGDNLLRDAASKIIVNAFSIPTTLTPESPFTDVNKGAWYYDYVLTAYNQSVLNGYKDAKGNLTYEFGPGNWLNRAEVAKLIVDAQNPVERTAEMPVEAVCGDNVCSTGETKTSCPADCTGVTPPVTKGALEVSLNDMSASSSTLPNSASSVKLATFDFTAADSDVTVTNLVVTRGGVGKAGDWDALYLYDGAKRLTTGRTVNNDTNTATFATTFTVDAGTTKSITLVGDVSSTATASNQHYFYIASAADVTTGAKSVAGDFPVAGNTFTMSAVTTAVNTVKVTTGSAISQPTIGQIDAEIASFKLTAGSTNDIAVHQISLTQNGSLSSDKMINLKLLRGTDEVATAKSFDGDRVTFVLSAPYVIPKGQTKSFYVHADINGGRTTDTIQLYLDENTDLTVIDQQYGFGAVVSNLCNATVTNGLKPAAAPCVGVAATALKGGTLTIADNGPSSKQIAQNVTNVQLLNYSVTAGRDLTVKNMDLTIDLSTGGNATTRPNVGVLGAGTVVTAPVAATGTITVIGDATGAGDTYTTTVGAEVAALVTWAVSDNATATALAAAINALPSYNAVAALNVVTVTAAAGGTAGNVLIGTVATDGPGGVVPTAVDTELTGGSNAGTTANVCLTGVTAGILVNDMVSLPAVGGTVYAIIKPNVGPNPCGANTWFTTNDTSGAALAAGTVQEINPYTLVKNVKIVDLDSGSTLQGPMTKASDGTLSGALNSDYMKTMSEDYELIGGEARHLSVQVDIDQTMASGYKLSASIDYRPAGYIKDMAANENVLIADIVGGVLTGKLMSTAANSLTVSKANTPSSQTFVKGDDKVPALGITLAAGDAGDILIKKLNVRVYGNTLPNNWVTATGDTAANNLVSSVTLYDGNDVVDGPRTLTLVDAVAPAGFSAGDYYKVLFDNLSLKILKGSTKTLTAKVKLLNSMNIPYYVAVDLVPADDITAEDVDANTITAAGGALNGALPKSPLLTLFTAGTLSATSEGNPDAKIVVAGSTMQLAGKYRFNAQKEGYNVNKLTILDEGALGTGGFETPALDSTAISQVVLKYTDVNGVSQTKTGSMSAGVSTFSDLGFFVPAGQNAYIEIYANVNDKTNAGGDKVSGQGYRLGIQDNGNTVSTFEAVGASSSTTLNTINVGGGDVTVNNAADVKAFIVRTTVPTFAKASGLGSQMVSGGADNRLYGLTVSADALGAVSFGRLTFSVANSNIGQLDGFKLIKGSLMSGLVTDTSAKAMIFNGATSADLAPGGAGNIAINTTAEVIVSFKTEETVGAGSSSTYFLDAAKQGNPILGEAIITKLAVGDDSTPVTGITVGAWNNGNANTARVYDAIANQGLFAATGDFATVGSIALTKARDIIWSDSSADSHLYPTIANNTGLVTTATGTYDWTNGYLLKTNVLTSQNVTK